MKLNARILRIVAKFRQTELMKRLWIDKNKWIVHVIAPIGVITSIDLTTSIGVIMS